MPTVAPAIPQNLAVQQANSQVLLSWDQVVGATSYKVYRSEDNITFSLLDSPTAFQYLDDTVVEGTEYWYYITASNGTESPASDTQSVVPAPTGKLSLGELRLRSQQRADRVGSDFVTDPEWNSYINQSYFELYDLLVQKYGDEYFVASPYSITTTGAQFYALPSDFYKLLGLDLNISNGNQARITVKKFEFISRNRYIYPQITTNLLGIAGMRYRIMGNQLMLTPPPAAGQILSVWYVPRMSELLADQDICDGVSGWTEYIIVDAAIKALQKEEGDVSVLLAQKVALIARIESAAENRDAGEPETISATRGATDMWGNGFPWGDGPMGGY